jgi:hypothetical protein
MFAEYPPPSPLHLTLIRSLYWQVINGIIAPGARGAPADRPNVRYQQLGGENTDDAAAAAPPGVPVGDANAATSKDTPALC